MGKVWLTNPHLVKAHSVPLVEPVGLVVAVSVIAMVQEALGWLGLVGVGLD